MDHEKRDTYEKEGEQTAEILEAIRPSIRQRKLSFL